MKKEKVKLLKELFKVLKQDILKLAEEKFLEAFYRAILAHYGVMVRYLDKDFPVIESIFGLCAVPSGVCVKTEESFRALCVDTPRDREALTRLLIFTDSVLTVIFQSYQSAARTNDRYQIQDSGLHCEVEVSESGLRLVPSCLDNHLVFVPGMENPADPLVQSKVNLLEWIRREGVGIKVVDPLAGISFKDGSLGIAMETGDLLPKEMAVFSRFIDTNYPQTVTYALFKLLDGLSLDRLFRCSSCGRFEITDRKKQSEYCSGCQTKHRVTKWRKNHPDEWREINKLQKGGLKRPKSGALSKDAD